MSITVFPWPPVAPRKWLWTWDHPVSTSLSVVDGAEDISQAFAPRRIAHVEVHGRRDGHAAGYMEILKRLLQGRVNAVRLNSWPVNWHLDATRGRSARQVEQLILSDGEGRIEWRDDTGTFSLVCGTFLAANAGADGAWSKVEVTGLPPGTLVARPGEFLTLHPDSGDVRGQVMAPAWSDGSGAATVRVLDPLPALTDVRVSIGTRDSAVFRATKVPTSPQPVGGDWSFSWEFREIFTQEAGGFVEAEASPWD